MALFFATSAELNTWADTVVMFNDNAAALTVSK
jgi:hypothetical protein